MITIHHLGVSQSDRIVWLMEELNLPYELKWYDRGADFLAPPEYRALHPVGTAPIIVDGDLVVASVLSGNRNFEGRVHSEVKMNYLASPPLVVAYALPVLDAVQ